MGHLIRKAVFPVAGFGTRFLPATKANPKEILPIVDKPLIQYAVEEAISAGITELIFVTNSSKRAIEDHFDYNYELEAELLKQQKFDLLEIVRGILPSGVSCAYIRQPEPLGLGHAVLRARTLIGQEPFAVLLADDLIYSSNDSCLKQMVRLFHEAPHSIVAIEHVAPEDVSKYGIVELQSSSISKGLNPLKGIVEKPAFDRAPSHLGVVGRYILTPSIFDELASCVSTSHQHEIQLTDAIHRLMKHEPVYAYSFRGRRYDCGSKLGYLEATLHYALHHPDLRDQFSLLLRKAVSVLDEQVQEIS